MITTKATTKVMQLISQVKVYVLSLEISQTETGALFELVTWLFSLLISDYYDWQVWSISQA